MESQETANSSSKFSAIPRISKLPQLRPSRIPGAERDGTGIPGTSGNNGITSRPARAGSISRSRALEHADETQTDSTSTRSKRKSMLIQPGFQTSFLSRDTQDEDEYTLKSPTLQTSNEEEPSKNPTESNTSAKIHRKPRPSLSDRTLETLSQIPPSPSPRRRQSGFYTQESPMRPPSRATSALDHSRPSSRMGPPLSPIRPANGPPSPSKRLEHSHIRNQSTATSPVKRSVSTYMPRSSTAANRNNTALPSLKSTSKLQQPRQSPVLPDGAFGLNGSKTVGSKPSTIRSSVKQAFNSDSTGQTAGGLPSSRSRTQLKPLTPLTIQRPPPQRQSNVLPSRRLQPAAPPSKTTNQPQETRSVPPSSQNLREVVAQARAARRSLSGSNKQAFLPRAIEDDSLANFGTDMDPSTFDVMDSTHINILRKRVDNARADGKLNVAALCLNELPSEVLRMYDTDNSGDGVSAWYENVDLTRLNAADNEITELPEDVFPDRTARTLSGEVDEDPPNGIFAGLEAMDMHGNLLKKLPINLGNLSRLTTLNLSRNQLTVNTLTTISKIKCLKDLRLSENMLSGSMSEVIGDLEDLEALDIHGNTISDLPSSLGKLSKLKILNVANNRLSTLPFEAIFDLPLSEINASRNKLSGSFLPVNIPVVPSLQILDVSVNALTSITEAEVQFPKLYSLNISNNKISALPDVTSWRELVTLNAEENKISQIPVGFTGLRHLKNADFGNNSLLQIDDAIGTMDNLVVLGLNNNPIRERRLMKLGTAELKAELRERSTPLSPSSERSGSLLSSDLSKSSAWVVTRQVLDRSKTRLKTIERPDLEPIVHEDVRTFNAHHNQLQAIPSSLELLGSTLAILDLSYNKFGPSEFYMTTDLLLPNLQSLNLTSSGLVTLEPLATCLSAPKLATLILPFNRVTALPRLCQAFPALSKLIASNNAIKELDVESVRGLQALDVSGNEIERLPPKLALLQGQLRTLMVGGNKFRVPSWGVLEKGTEEILNWCRMKIPAGEEGAIAD